MVFPGAGSIGLNDDGTPDAGFNSGGAGANDYIRDIVVQIV